jgi:RNA polymerase-binding transcription factor DksA
VERPHDDPVTDPAQVLIGAEACLTAVDDALRRLDGGSYGRCSVCGAHLPQALLEHDPLAVHCPTCGPA